MTQEEAEAAVQRVFPGGQRRALQTENGAWAGWAGSGPSGHVLVPTIAIPSAGIESGEVLLVLAFEPTKGAITEIRGHVRRLPRSKLVNLLAHQDKLIFVPSSVRAASKGRAIDRIRRAHNHPRARLEHTGPVLVIRPWGVVSSSILAFNDQDAITQLLAAAGCCGEVDHA